MLPLGLLDAGGQLGDARLEHVLADLFVRAGGRSLRAWSGSGLLLLLAGGHDLGGDGDSDVGWHVLSVQALIFGGCLHAFVPFLL